MNTRKRTLFLTLAFLLGTNSFATLASGADTNLPLLKSAYEQHPNQQETAYDYALALARSGQYSVALTIFQQLSANTPTPIILYDHAVVLAWSGDYFAAISLYEDKIIPMNTAIPTYVKSNMAGAYYHLTKFNEAQLLFHDVALSGDRQAKRWEAESFARMNDSKSANGLYNELLTENENDVDTYLSRASMFISLGNNTSAAIDINKALELLPNNQLGNEKRCQIRSDMAVLFIQSGDCSSAIILLQPTITAGSATTKMQANYIFALRINGDYKLAIQQATKLWPDLKAVPDFGLQALADCYLRTQQPEAAKSIYHIILTRNNKDTNLQAIKLSLAYADLKTANLQTGLELYKDVLLANPSSGTVVAGDADAFINAGQIHAGKQLYKLLITQFPTNKLYLKNYATILTAKNMPRGAYQQYEALNQLKNGDLVGLSGIVSTSITIGDYKTAYSATKNLQEDFPTNPIAGQSIQQFENRTQKSMEVNYQILQDYKGNDVKGVELTANQHLDGRFSILARTDRKKVSDTTTSVSLDSYGLGLQYQDVKRDATLWLDSYHQNSSFSGYRLLTNHYFDDMTFIGINMEKTPVQDPQALIYPIMSTSQEISFNRRLGLKDFYSLAFTSASYSDGNRSTTYGTTFNHTMVSTNSKNVDWFTYLNRTNYKYQEINNAATLYESPIVREAYGAGIKERWMGPKNYWEATLTTEWGRDRPESFGFSPSLAIEYGYTVSPNKSLVIRAEYGFHTDTTDSRTLGFGSRQYHINYNMAW